MLTQILGQIFASPIRGVLLIVSIFMVSACQVRVPTMVEAQATEFIVVQSPTTIEKQAAELPAVQESTVPSPVEKNQDSQNQTAETKPTERPRPARQPTIEAGPYQVEVFQDIPYTSQRKLDVYAPQGSGVWPVVVVYHGGLGTPKEAMKGLAEAIAQYGVVVFVPTWQTMPWNRLPQGAEDAACAVRFSRAHAAEYNANPSRVTGVGHSGGATIGSLIALIGDNFVGDCLVEEGSGYLEAFVALEGPYYMPAFAKSMGAYSLAPEEMWEELSPLLHAQQKPAREGVEFHIFIGEDIQKSKREDTDAFYEALLETGYPATLTVLSGVSHMYFAAPLEQTVEAVLELALR
jgi:acetyl esterase/lipase